MPDTKTPLRGIHHVTALAGAPPENHRFYTQTLGLRLVKRTVNFDDPTTWHLYFGDRTGSPGSLLTHFPDRRTRSAVHGSPEIIETTLSVAPNSLDTWRARLEADNIEVHDDTTNNKRTLRFQDPHTMRLALTESNTAPSATPDNAVGHINHVTILVPDINETADFLESTLGFNTTTDNPDTKQLGLNEHTHLLTIAPGNHHDPAKMGAGTVHHVAWRVETDDDQAEVARRLTAARIPVTPVKDRQYFRSIYFRIPGGVIFEVATDAPGFTLDEPEPKLGTSLKLPPQFEPRRTYIESTLDPLEH